MLFAHRTSRARSSTTTNAADVGDMLDPADVARRMLANSSASNASVVVSFRRVHATTTMTMTTIIDAINVIDVEVNYDMDGGTTKASLSFRFANDHDGNCGRRRWCYGLDNVAAPEMEGKRRQQ